MGDVGSAIMEVAGVGIVIGDRPGEYVADRTDALDFEVNLGLGRGIYN